MMRIDCNRKIIERCLSVFSVKRNFKNKEIITYDQYDGRAILDDLPEEVPIKYDYTLESKGDDDKDLEIMLNYERYNMLVDAYRTSGDINTSFFAL